MPKDDWGRIERVRKLDAERLERTARLAIAGAEVEAADGYVISESQLLPDGVDHTETCEECGARVTYSRGEFFCESCGLVQV